MSFFKRLRRNLISKPLYGQVRKALPGLSETEREALEAGDIWWDAELFSGNPDWRKLRQTPPVVLSDEEQQFMDGPTEQLCQMLNDWDINWIHKDLPAPVWEFIRQNKFFAMIIPKLYGGLEFSAYANSEIIRKISSRSSVAAVTVMVPNSLGPGELLLQFGTENQRNHWLPRLAQGIDIPCFGLTSPEAGSDAASMVDRGVICHDSFGGEKNVLGIRLNWHKRYITLGPVATVLGLAFKLYDPDSLVGDQEDIGITVALVPTDLPGVEIGRRHLPAYQMFQNGPNKGKDVFIPMDYVIGGREQLGGGWKMLMTALAAGRGVSLPSLSAASTAFTARTTGAYSRVREQFGIPIGKFEGVQKRLGRLAATAYQLDAARRLTCAALAEGYKPAVVSAIMKAHATDQMRDSVTDAMDVHAGKAVIDGPSNYLGGLYRAVPVGITVEGANILTRNLIVFGQGSIRCHPWLLKEMLAFEESDKTKAIDDFDRAVWGHAAHFFKSLGRAWLRTWTGGLLSPRPTDVPYPLRSWYRQLSRYSASFALISEATIVSLGGALKRKEMISARLGDILSELYFLSAVLKRWEDEGCLDEDLVLVRYCMERGLTTIEQRYSEVLRNLPNRFAAFLVRLIGQPLGPSHHGPSDALIMQCADVLLSPSEARDRLTAGLHAGTENESIAHLEKAFRLITITEPLRQKMKDAGVSGIEEAFEMDILSTAQAETLRETQEYIDLVVAVDDFAPEELTGPSAAKRKSQKSREPEVTETHATAGNS